ncbi:MAG: J domain-containing protein [Bacteroidetes bacterium]|nr:J domain-containing protein [Bacteroidota bacterium]
MTHYQLLGILPTATADQIRAAYRKKAFQFHPDRNKSHNANQQFIAVRLAYETLSDPKRRVKYDEKIDINRFPVITEQQPSMNSSYVYDDEKISDIYEEIEYLKHIHYDPIEEWVKLYRMSWKEWYTIPKIIKLKKIGAELIFRSLYALIGMFVIVFVYYYLFYGNEGNWNSRLEDKSFMFTFVKSIIVTAGIFFIFAKSIGRIYREFKKED